jgi:tetratricopeptide (TPR) repeat protein
MARTVPSARRAAPKATHSLSLDGSIQERSSLDVPLAKSLPLGIESRATPPAAPQVVVDQLAPARALAEQLGVSVPTTANDGVLFHVHALAEDLAETNQWRGVIECVKLALSLDPRDGRRLSILALGAWAAWEVDDLATCRLFTAEARDFRELYWSEPDAARRVLVVSGHLADLRGDSCAAVAWYKSALEHTGRPTVRAHVLIEVGSALAKVRDYDEARKSLILARSSGGSCPPDPHVRAHALSRQAVIEEVQGDVGLAVQLQQDAIVLARTRATDPELLFAAYRRLARHHLDAGNCGGAHEAIEAAAVFAGDVRRGQLSISHDRAWLALAEGRIEEAREGYRDALSLLPTEADLILEAHAGLWKEIAGGLSQVLRLSNDLHGSALADRAIAEARHITASGSSDAPSGLRSTDRRSALAAVEELRRHVAKTRMLYTKHYTLDLDRRVARHRETGVEIVLPSRAWDVLCYLADHGGKAKSRDLSPKGDKVSGGAIRSAIQVMRVRLHLQDDELIVSERFRGGGYALAPDARDPRRR